MLHDIDLTSTRSWLAMRKDAKQVDAQGCSLNSQQQHPNDPPLSQAALQRTKTVPNPRTKRHHLPPLQRCILPNPGFAKLENLESYHGLKSLWLEGNGISKIENLGIFQNNADSLVLMRCLYIIVNSQKAFYNKTVSLQSRGWKPSFF